MCLNTTLTAWTFYSFENDQKIQSAICIACQHALAQIHETIRHEKIRILIGTVSKTGARENIVISTHFQKHQIEIQKSDAIDYETKTDKKFRDQVQNHVCF